MGFSEESFKRVLKGASAGGKERARRLSERRRRRIAVKAVKARWKREGAAERHAEVMREWWAAKRGKLESRVAEINAQPRFQGEAT